MTHGGLSEEEAKQALAKANNYRLDRSHVFKLSPLDDYHKYMAIPDEEVELKPPPYEPSENLKGWLLDEQARDQYVVRYNEETEIWWNDAVKGQQDADPAYAKRASHACASSGLGSCVTTSRQPPRARAPCSASTSRATASRAPRTRATA